MRTPIPLAASTRRERSEAIWRMSEALTEAGAVVLDHRMFSNVALAVFFEAEPTAAGRVGGALTGAGLMLDAASLVALAAAAAGTGARSFALHVTFVHNDPDLAIEVPKVPG
jgi:hypothetical protein